MVTKELLSAVLQRHIELFEVNGNEVVYTSHHYFSPVYAKSINIYEIMHLCKIYVTGKSIGIDSGYSSSYKGKLSKAFCNLYLDATGYCSKFFEADTEPEAVLAATQWVLNNKPS